MADRREYLPRIDHPDRRLGRHVNHDPESLRYLVAPPYAAVTPKSVAWERHVPSFDQGSLGSCTVQAGLGILATDPYWDTLPKELQTQLASPDIQTSLAQPLYREETRLDPFSGAWEPNDTGSDGLSSAKTLKNHGWISGYLHATSLAACHEAIQQGPFMIGILWYQNMFYPDTGGVVTPGGAVAGGHEIECNEYDLTRDLWWFPNSWTPDWGKNGRFALTSATFQSLLSQQGDATSLVPITAPAPTPIDPPSPPASTKTITFADSQVAILDTWAAARRLGDNGRAAAAWKTGKR